MHYTISDQIGTITELMSEKGYIHYRQKLNLWGKAKTETLHYHRASNDEIICNHRFVGQYYDEESGLHYNRFRYYSPETAQYLQSDPIGLLGGFNPYGYVGIPTAFVDPLGLNTCPSLKTDNKTPPNPYGKKGGPKHQDKIRKIEADIESRGLEPRTEYRYETPNGHKSSRYADVVAMDKGKVVEVHQVGKSLKKLDTNGNVVPISRERKAIEDIKGSTNYNGANIIYHSYDR